MTLPLADPLPQALRRTGKYLLLQRVCDDIGAHPGLVRRHVASSDVPGVFNFGGDLALFVLLVAGDTLGGAQDRAVEEIKRFEFDSAWGPAQAAARLWATAEG